MDPCDKCYGLVPRGSLKPDIGELQTFNEMEKDFVTVIDQNFCARRVYFRKLHNGIYYGYLADEERCVHFDLKYVHIIVRGCRMNTGLFADGYAALCTSIINDLKLRHC